MFDIKAVRMTSFGQIMNEIFSVKDKADYIDELISYPLLIIDDLGSERSSEYAQEIVYSIIDGRYKAGKPLIITTNLTLDEIQNPQDMRYARIYDRILEMCVPIQFNGKSRRKDIFLEKRDRVKALFDEVSENE